MKDEEKCCGGCCWFYGEMTCGYGFCAHTPFTEFLPCDGKCRVQSEFISREEMRHHMAVLLQDIRWNEDTEFIRYSPDGDEATKAKKFAYKYIKTFSKL